MKVWVKFDGPPAHESGRFIEVEDENGSSVGVPWTDNGDGTWSLGPLEVVEL